MGWSRLRSRILLRYAAMLRTRYPAPRGWDRGPRLVFSRNMGRSRISFDSDHEQVGPSSIAEGAGADVGKASELARQWELNRLADRLVGLAKASAEN